MARSRGSIDENDIEKYRYRTEDVDEERTDEGCADRREGEYKDNPLDEL